MSSKTNGSVRGRRFYARKDGCRMRKSSSSRSPIHRRMTKTWPTSEAIMSQVSLLTCRDHGQILHGQHNTIRIMENTARREGGLCFVLSVVISHNQTPLYFHVFCARTATPGFTQMQKKKRMARVDRFVSVQHSNFL